MIQKKLLVHMEELRPNCSVATAARAPSLKTLTKLHESFPMKIGISIV